MYNIYKKHNIYSYNINDIANMLYIKNIQYIAKS